MNCCVGDPFGAAEFRIWFNIGHELNVDWPNKETIVPLRHYPVMAENWA